MAQADPTILLPTAAVAELKGPKSLLTKPPQLLQRALTKYGLNNKTVQAAFQKFSKAYLDGDEAHQNVTLREMTSIVLNQMADHFERVSAEQWKMNQIESWQGQLLQQAGPAFADTDQYRMTITRWGDPKAIYAPVGTAPRILELEMEEQMFTSLRYARGIQVPLDALFTESGFQTIIDGIGHLLQGALVTQALLMTEELIGQRFYESERLNRCINVAQYESLLERNDTLRCAYNKFDNPQAIYENEARADMAPYTDGGPDTWIVSEDALAFLKNNLKVPQQYYESGKKLNYTGHTDTKRIQKVDSSLGSPTGDYFPLPSNFLKDSPLNFKVIEGSAWNMGQDPNKLPLKNMDPAKFDIDMFCKAPDNKARLQYLHVLDALAGFFDNNGNIAPIPSSGPNYKSEQDEQLDPFQMQVGEGKAFKPIRYYGQYNIAHSELLVRHAQSLVQLAATSIGKEVKDFNKAFADWFDFVEKSDATPFDELTTKLNDAAFEGGEKATDAYAQHIKKTTAEIKMFSSSYTKLKQFADANDVVATEFMRYLRALVAAIDSVHTCLITHPDATAPDIWENEQSPEAALYTRCMAAMKMEHFNIFMRENASGGRNITADIVTPLAMFFGTTTGPSFIKDYAATIKTVKQMDEALAYIAALVSYFTEHGMAKPTLEDNKINMLPPTLGPDGKLLPADKQVKQWVGTWDELTAFLSEKGRLGRNSALELSSRLKAAAKAKDMMIGGDTLGQSRYSMTDLSIPKNRYREFINKFPTTDALPAFVAQQPPAKYSDPKEGDLYSSSSTGIGFTLDDGKRVDEYGDMPVSSASGFMGRGIGKESIRNPALRTVDKVQFEASFVEKMKEIISVTDTPAFQHHISMIRSYCRNDVEKFATCAVLFSKFDKMSVRRAVLNGCIPLLNLLVVSPEITYRATSTVGLKRGGDTGMINTTQMDMRFAISATIKYFLGHLSFKFGVWITNPKNVWPWIGSYAHGVLSGGRGGEAQLTTDRDQLVRGYKDLAVMPLSAEDWPMARHFSFIGRYPLLDESEDNKCTCFISTAYRNNQVWKVYKSRQENYIRPILSPGSVWYMNEQGRFDDFYPDQGIFGKRAVPGLHKLFLGIQRIKED